MRERYMITLVHDGKDVLSEDAGERNEAVTRAWWRRQSTRRGYGVMVTLPDGRKLKIEQKWSMQDIDNEITRRREG